MILASKLYDTYRSYFPDRILDREVLDKIYEWVDRDLKWANEQARQLEQKPRNAKLLFAWFGTGERLGKILKLNK